MLGFGPISSAPISALPDSLLGFMSISFTATGTLSAAMSDTYADFLRSGATVRRIYTVEIAIKAAA
jgi:hypothetical protein